MALEQQFTCVLPNGIHARPASALEEVVRAFHSEVVLVNQRTLRIANAKSILAIVGADIRHDDRFLFKVSGPDEREAMAALSAFLNEKFSHCDQPLPTVDKSESKVQLPRCLSTAGAVIEKGIGVVSGIGLGQIVQVGQYALPASIPSEGVLPAKEWSRLEAALEEVAKETAGKQSALSPGVERELLAVHQAIARDVEFRQKLHYEIMDQQRSAVEAIVRVGQHFSDILQASGNELLRDRALDIQDVCTALLRELCGPALSEARTELVADSIVVAESLTPGQFLGLNRDRVKGLVLAHASTTSHTVILARSFGVPTLAGMAGISKLNFNQPEAVVDADLGVLVTQLTEKARRYYALELKRLAGRSERLMRLATQPAATRDHHRIEVVANIATAAEAPTAFASGAEGIGLFRTEMLFLDRESAPDEAEQFAAYRDVLIAANGRSVVIRTLDVGGDKKLAYLKLPAEENPFLGARAIRIYPEFESLFRTQLRALIRASAFGKLAIMFPMIATVDEARWLKRLVVEEQKKCAAENLQFDASMSLGAMIEVPSAVFNLEALCREFDFFSIGSNDLLQYFMAADRMNQKLASLYDPLQPAFLRLLKQTIDTAHLHGKSISLCGEMSAQPNFAPLLAGLGVDKISTPAPVLAAIKTELAQSSLPECRQLIAQALQCDTAAEVAACVRQFSMQHDLPLLEPDSVMMDVDATNKEEAIKQASDLLFVMGRTDDPRTVEEAIWQREASYSTGFGYGFAIPHCKSNAVRHNSLILLKLRSPIEWNSLDGQPVSVVIMLAIREDQAHTTHMKVLAKLARKVMDDAFRSQLETENSPAELCAILRSSYEA